MDIAQSTSSKKAAKPQLSPYQEGVSKALKQAGEAHVMEAVQQGVTPQHIEQQAGLVDPNTLNQLMQLAGTPVQSKGDGTLLGDKVGVLSAILKTLTGNPTSPFQNKTEPLGLDNAVQLAGFQQTANKNNMDSKKFPLEMQKLAGDVEQQPLQTQKLQGEVASNKQSLRQNDPNFKINMKVREKAAEQYADLSPKAVFVANTLNELAPVAESLGEFETGLLNQFGGRSKAFAESFGKNPNFIKFDRLVNKILPSLARLGGDTGVLSDPDIARWQKVLGDKTAPIASKIESINELMGDLKINMQERMELSGSKPTTQVQKMIMDFKPIQVVSGKPGAGKTGDNKDSDVLTRLGLDPNKFELVSNG